MGSFPLSVAHAKTRSEYLAEEQRARNGHQLLSDKTAKDAEARSLRSALHVSIGPVSVGLLRNVRLTGTGACYLGKHEGSYSPGSAYTYWP